MNFVYLFPFLGILIMNHVFSIFFLQPAPCIFLAKTAERVRTAIALAHLALEGLNVKNVRFLQYYLFYYI